MVQLKKMDISFYPIYWDYLPVFFITDVRLLRMELIFARSTLARFGKAKAGEGDRREVFTGFGRGGVAVMVTGTEAHEEAFETLSVGFIGAEVEIADFSIDFSFLSSTVCVNKEKRQYYIPLFSILCFQYETIHPSIS
jgi:hypothetical protein